MSFLDEVNRSFGSYDSADPFGAGSAMPGDAPVHESWMDVPVFSRTETMPKFTADEERPQAGWSEAILSPIAEEPASWKQTIGGLAQLPLIRSIPGVGEWGKALGEEGMRQQEKIQPRFEDASPEYYGYLTGKTLVPMFEDMALLAGAGALMGGGTPLSAPLAAAGATAGALKNVWRLMKLRAAMNATRTGAQEYNKLKQNGFSDWAAIPIAIGYGGLEWLGDKVGLSALEAPNLSVLKRLVLSAASEVPGETGTTIGQAFLDKISTDPDMTMSDFVKQVRDTVVVAGMVGGGGGALAIPASRRFQAMEDKAKARAQVPEEAWTGMKEALNNMVKDIGRVMPTIEQEYGTERAAALKRYLLFGIPMPPELEIAPTERLARELRDRQLNEQFGFGVDTSAQGTPNLPELGPGVAPFLGPAGGPPGAGPGGGVVAGAGQPQSYVDKLSGPPAGTQATVTEQLSQRDEAARIKDLEQKRQADLIGSGAATVIPGAPGAAPGVPTSAVAGPSLVGSPLPGRQTIVPGAPTPPTTGSTSQQMFGVPSPAIAATEQGLEGGELGVGTGPTSEAYARWKQQAISAFMEALRTGQEPNIPPLPGGVVTPQAISEAAREARKLTGEASTPMPGMQTPPSPLAGPLGPAPTATTPKAQTGLRLGERKGVLTPQVQPNPPGLPTTPPTQAAGAPSAPPAPGAGTITPVTPPLPGTEIQTPAAPAGTTGTSATITTPNQKTKITVRYRVAEADSVVASNDPVTFAPNPSYPPALQPRERAREGYQLQIEGMVAALNPEMLMASPTTAQGAPVVGPDMVVESGNGRSMAIKRAYVSSPMQGAAYKQALIDNAAALGLDPNVIAGMTNPVLVRERTSDVPDRAAFTKEAGEADVSGTSAVEKARVDAQNMSQRLAELAVIDDDGNFDPLSKANAQFVAEWLQTVPASERGALWQNGMLTREGVARIKNALFAKAYPASDKLLTLVAESADPEIKNVTNTLLGFAPAFARLRAMTEQGTRDGGLMVADEMARAAELYLDFKNQSALDLQGFLLQQGLLAETQHADVTKAIAAVFNEHARSQTKLRTFINHTLRLANESGQGNLLGEMSPETKGDIVFLAYNLTEGGKKNDAIIRNILGLSPQAAGKDTGVLKSEPGKPGEGEGIQTPAGEGAAPAKFPAVAGPQEQKVASVEKWYDRKTRSWVVQRKDAAGNQIGNAVYVGSKPEAVAQEKEWKAEMGKELPAAGEETPELNQADKLMQRLDEIQKRLDAIEQTTGEKPFAVGEKVTYLGKPATVESYKGMGTVNVRTEAGNVIGAKIKDVTKGTPLPAAGEETPEGKVEKTGNLNQGALPGLSATETFELTAQEERKAGPEKAAAAPEQTALNFYDDTLLPAEAQKARKDSLQAELDLFGTQAQTDETVPAPVTVPVRERTAAMKPKPTDPKLIGANVKAEMNEKGFTSFMGKVIKFISDLGFLARLARSFRFEYMHYIAIDKSTGKVILENKLTSFSNKTVDSGTAQELETFIGMARTISKGDIQVYLLHNHPGRNPMPSDNDIRLTEQVSVICTGLNVEFGGHVIMNSDAYSVVNDANLQEYMDKVFQVEGHGRKRALLKIEGAYRPMEGVTDELRTTTGNAVIDSVLGREPIIMSNQGYDPNQTAMQLAAYGMMTKTQPNTGVAFFIDNQMRINALTDMPLSYLTGDPNVLADFLKRAAENLGARHVMVWMPTQLTAEQQKALVPLMERGYLREVVYQSGGTPKSVVQELIGRKEYSYAKASLGEKWDLGTAMTTANVRKNTLRNRITPIGATEGLPPSPTGIPLQEQAPGELSPANDEVTQQVLEGQPVLENQPAIRDRVVGEVPLPERSATRYPYFGGGLLGRIIDTIRTYKYVDKGIQDRDVKALESLFMTPWALRKEHPEMKTALEIELQRHQDRKDLNAQLVGDPENWNPENPVEHPIFGLSDNEIKALQKVAQTSTVENVLYTDEQIKGMLAMQGVTNPEEVKRITRGYRAMKASYDAAIKKQIEARENMLFFPYQNEPWAADLERIIRLEDDEGKGARKPEKMAALDEALANYSTEEQARFRKAFATITEPWNLVKKYRQSMGQRVFYTPLEHGEGDYILRITKPDEDGKPQVVWSYRTRTALEASKIWEELKRDPEMKDLHGLPGTITKEAGTPESAYYRVYDDNLYRFMQIGMERLRASKSYDDEDIAVFTKKMSQALADELKARAFGQRMMRRRHSEIGGYERKDIRASFLDYMAGTSGIITKQEAAAKFYDLLRSVDKNKPGTYDYVSRYVDDMLRNRDDIDRFFDKGKHMATLYYIAGNLRLPLVQITQNMIMSVPMMAREISKIDTPKSPEGLMKNLYKLGKHTTEAHRRVIGAMKDITTGNMTEDEKVAVDTATRQGVTDAQFLKEIYGRMTNKWDRGAVKTFDYAMQPFQLLERMNRQAAFLSMYRLQKEAGMKAGLSEAEAKAAAIKKGNEFVYDTQVLYGKANMPEAMRGKTVGSKLLGMAYTFKQYPHHFIQYLSQGIKEGHKTTIERMGEDADRLKFGPSMVYETPRFLYNYMKNALSAPGFEATILSMAWTVALGGAAAFPFLDDLLELYEKATGNPVRAKMNRVVRGGVPTMIGMDIGSSLKISAPWTMGTNFMEGLSESALGVYGGIAEKFGKSMEAAWSGNYYKAIESGAPTMIEYPMKAYREYTEGAHTPRGKTIFDSDGNPLQPTFGEAALQAVGIKGARMKEEAQIYRSFDMIEERFNKWRDRIYKQYRQADTYEKQSEVMAEITKFNMESQQKGMGGIAPITRESIKRAIAEKPSKKWLRFGQGINAE